MKKSRAGRDTTYAAARCMLRRHTLCRAPCAYVTSCRSGLQQLLELTSVHGIGYNGANKLYAAGVRSVSQLREILLRNEAASVGLRDTPDIRVAVLAHGDLQQRIPR